MSHYSVLVLADNGVTVDELLTPYDANIEVDPYIGLTKEEAIQDMRDYFAYIRESLVDAKECSGWKTVVLDYIDRESNTLKDVTVTDEVLAQFDEKIASYTDDELYAQYIALECKEDSEWDEDGVYTTYNPDSKWDWYCEGGRWNDGIPTIEGYNTNRCQVCDIDFSPRKDDLEAAERFWEIGIEKNNEGVDDEDKVFVYPSRQYYIDRYGTKDNYIADTASFKTYAVVTPDGEWHESGKIGWFGLSAATPEEENEFATEYEALVSQYPYAVAHLVDCHI